MHILRCYAALNKYDVNVIVHLTSLCGRKRIVSRDWLKELHDVTT